MYYEQMMSLIRREIVRTMRYHHQQPRLGLVSSYDKKLHAVKVRFQPVGTESGWIPLTALGTGNQFGVLSAPNIMDQVEVHYQEGDHNVGRVVTRHFSKYDKPPQLEAGEHAIIHKTGSGSYYKQDGTVQHAGPQFFQVGQTGQGKSGNTSTGGSDGNTGQQVPQQQQQQQQNQGKQILQYNPDGSSSYTVPNGQHTVTVQKNISVTSQQNDISITASQGNISRSAHQSISDSAQSIAHNGNTNVTGTLGVSQVTTSLAYNTTSDERAKDNIAPLSNVLDKVMGLEPSRFDLYETSIEDGAVKRKGDPIQSVGLIAQRVRETFPELVSGDEEREILSLSESKLGVILLAAFQEYVAATEHKIAALNQRIDELSGVR